MKAEKGERIDKFLWFVRLYKSRSIATEECRKGRVIISGHPAKPASLIAMIPALAKGIYSVKVVTQYTGGSVLLKSPRINVFNRTLEVK